MKTTISHVDMKQLSSPKDKLQVSENGTFIMTKIPPHVNPIHRCKLCVCVCVIITRFLYHKAYQYQPLWTKRNIKWLSYYPCSGAIQWCKRSQGPQSPQRTTHAIIDKFLFYPSLLEVSGVLWPWYNIAICTNSKSMHCAWK